MSFTDTLITYDSAGGYAGVHCKQKYDAIATALAANANWSLVDTVDFVSAPSTYRSYVWKCSSAGSGLPADYFVVFTLQFVTATGVWTAGNATWGSPQISLAEGYNSTTKVLSKYACAGSGTTMTLNSDLTSPGTWTLTATRNVTAPNAVAWATYDVPTSVLTSLRVLIMVTNSHFVAMTSIAAGAPGIYVGAFDTHLNSTDDPMPIVLAAATSSVGGTMITSGSTTQMAATTRNPKLSAAAYAYVFQYSYGIGHGAATQWAAGYVYNVGTNASGVVGDPSNLNWSLFQGGVMLSPIGLVTSGNAINGATRGGLRGFLRGIVAGYMAVHTIGDTFTVGGVTYAGTGLTSQGSCISLDTSL